MDCALDLRLQLIQGLYSAAGKLWQTTFGNRFRLPEMLKRQMSQPCPHMVPQSGMCADRCLLLKHAKKESPLCTGILLRWLSVAFSMPVKCRCPCAVSPAAARSC